MTTKFDDFVREVEDGSTDEERRVGFEYGPPTKPQRELVVL